MMIRRPIRNLHDGKMSRFCDVVVTENGIFLELKFKTKVMKIPWSDILAQVNIAIKDMERMKKTRQIQNAEMDHETDRSRETGIIST